MSEKEMAMKLLWVISLMMPIYAFAHCCYFTLRSGGRTMMTFIFDSGFSWLISVPLAFCLAHFTKMDIIYVYLCCQLADAAKCIMGFAMIKSGSWISNIVADS